MIAHVLGTGPSLAAFRRQVIGPVIAINRAVDFTTADWAVVGDATTFDRITGIPMTGVCTFNAVARTSLPTDWRHLMVACWEDLLAPEPPQWGIQAALYLARMLACGQPLVVHLHGVDHAGTDDWDGTPAADDRSAARWRREADMLGATIAHLTASTRTKVVWHKA